MTRTVFTAVSTLGALRGAALLALAAIAGSAAANSGRIEFALGGATVQSGSGPQRTLAKGMDVVSGDTIRTGADGIVHIRYSDGAMVALRSDALYSIDSYRYGGQADGSEQGFFKLLKGTMRVVTGAVGRANRNRFALTTPTATIGIRGTGGVVSVDSATGATSLFGTSGTWDLRAQTGTGIPVGAGQTGVTTTTDQPAQQVSAAGAAVTAPGNIQPQDPGFRVPETRTPEGDPALGDSGHGGIGGSGTTVVTTFIGEDSGFTTSAPSIPGFSSTEVTIENGLLTGYKRVEQGSEGQYTDTTTVSGGTLAESGTVGPITWGRIVDAVVTQVYTSPNYPESTDIRTIGPNGGFYFATGTPTPVMPTSGTFTYNMVAGAGGTPTLSSGASASASLNSLTATGSFTPTGGDIAFTGQAALNGGALSISTSGVIAHSGFSTFGDTTGAACDGTCYTFITGSFYGDNASHAAAGYIIYLPSDTLGGNAILVRQ